MSRRSFRKQLLSFILCLCMVLSLMSTAVLGADCVNHTDADMDGVCDACVLLPAMEKSQLFRGVIADGILPRKTFSMGHSREKRYYLEGRAIK